MVVIKTIRFWDMKTGEEKKCLRVGKVVSCVDYLPMRKSLLLSFMMGSAGAYFFAFVLFSNWTFGTPSK